MVELPVHHLAKILYFTRTDSVIYYLIDAVESGARGVF